MNPYTYFKNTKKDEVERVAREAGTTFDYFKQIAYGHRRPSYRLAKNLISASGGKLDLEGLMEAKEYQRI